MNNQFRVGQRVIVVRDLEAEALEEKYDRHVPRQCIGWVGTVSEADEDDSGDTIYFVKFPRGLSVPFHREELAPTSDLQPFISALKRVAQAYLATIQDLVVAIEQLTENWEAWDAAYKVQAAQPSEGTESAS